MNAAQIMYTTHVHGPVMQTHYGIGMLEWIVFAGVVDLDGGIGLIDHGLSFGVGPLNTKVSSEMGFLFGS